MPGSFEHLKKALCKEPILQYPNIGKPYTLFTDASHIAYSGVLIQEVESPEDLRPIAYTSGLFSDMQQRLSVTEKEVFSVYPGFPLCLENLEFLRHFPVRFGQFLEKSGKFVNLYHLPNVFF